MDKFWGLKQGANAYLVKPIDGEELLRKVKDYSQAESMVFKEQIAGCY